MRAGDRERVAVVEAERLADADALRRERARASSASVGGRLPCRITSAIVPVYSG